MDTLFPPHPVAMMAKNESHVSQVKWPNLVNPTTFRVGILSLGLMAGAAPVQANPLAEMGTARTSAQGVLQAQSSPDLPDAPPAQPLPSIQPRFMGQFTSGPGLGYESSFGSLYGLIPLFQVPGKSLGFAEARLNFATAESTLGGNFLLGYRQYSKPSNLVWGAYAGYDLRDTGPSTFSQLGAGLEVAGNTWEARLNGYLPIGETRNLTSWDSTSLGSSLQNLNFERNLLFATMKTSTQIDKGYESAFGGVDLEVGTRIARWSHGELRGYVGGYFYDGPGADAFPGFRSRLSVRQGDAFTGGVEFTTDEQFGSRVTFTVGLGFGGARGRARDPEDESLVARLQAPVQRQLNIVVEEQAERQIIDSFDTYAVANPSTGAAWTFTHVSSGGAGGNGSYEDPFGSVASALPATSSDGNAIVYVQSGSNPGMAGFAIPEAVQVLSSGPRQFVPASIMGRNSVVELPGSGTGLLPTINGTVNMGNRTALNGFSLRPQLDQPGVIGTEVSNVVVANNRIVTSGKGASGILINASHLDAIPGNEILISGNNVSTNGSKATGIEVQLMAGSVDRLQLIGNTVSTDGADSAHGIRVRAANGGSIGALQIHRNSVSTAGPLSEGIYLSSNDGGRINTAEINDNTVFTSGTVPNDANTFELESDGIYVNALRQGQIQRLEVSRNSVTTLGNDADGIYLIAGQGGTIQTAVVSGNTVSTTGNAKISNQAAEGIKLLAYSEGKIVNASILGNSILQSEGNGITIRVVSANFSDGGSICVNLSGNNVQNTNVTGGQIDATPYSFFNPGNKGTISVVGSDLEDVTSANTPSDPAAYSKTGPILLVPSCP